MEKYKIEKNSVQETLVIPLYGCMAGGFAHSGSLAFIRTQRRQC